MTTEIKQTSLLTVRQFVAKHPWPSESALRAYIAGAPANGFSAAFKRVGRRVLVAEHDFFAVIDKLQQKEEVKEESF